MPEPAAPSPAGPPARPAPGPVPGAGRADGVASAQRLRPAGDRLAALDDLTRLAARLTGASGSQVSLATDVQVRVGGTPGAPGDAPLADSLCALTTALGSPLQVADTRADERLRHLAPVVSGQVRAYLGVPLRDRTGAVLGALCVLDTDPHEWTPAATATLEQLAPSVVTELELAAVSTEFERERLRWGLAVDAAGIGTFDWDLVTGELVWDDRMTDLFGYTRESFDGTIEAFSARLHPDDRGRVGEVIDAAIAVCGALEVEYRVQVPDRGTRWVQARGRVLAGAGGTAVRVLGASYDTTGDRDGDSRVARVLEAMPAGFCSLDHRWRFTRVNAEAERLLGRSREELLGQVVWDAFPETVDSVVEESFRRAVTSGRPVSFDAHHPAPLDGWYELRAWPTPDGVSVYSLEVTDRREAQARAERAAARLAVLADVGAELASTLDAVAAAGRVARRVVPTLADWCTVTALTADGTLRDVGSRHSDPDRRAQLDRWTRTRLEALSTTSAVWTALRTGQETEVDGLTALGQVEHPATRALLAELAPEQVLALPMRGRDRVLGLLTLVDTGGRRFTATDRTTAREVADRVGTALDAARLHDHERKLAEELQRSLLTDPPEPDHAQIVVRYQPAAEAARVGGDWYDAFLQPSGATMLVIGDVAGHDTRAAALMGQLRGLLRGIATYSDAGPAEVLRGLDASMAMLELPTLATATVARFEQTPAEVDAGVTRVVWANAGHPPPLVVAPDGGVRVLGDWSGDLLLGVDPTTRRREHTAVLDRGSTVLLYTDGLVERQDDCLDEGLGRLVAAVSELTGSTLDELCDGVLARLVDGRPADDVALVAIRLHRQDRPRPGEAGPRHVPAAAPAPLHPRA